MKALYLFFHQTLNRFFPKQAYRFARRIPGLAPSAEQLKVLLQHGIQKIKLEFRPNMGIVVPRIYWTDWETDFWLPIQLQHGLPREPLLITKVAPQTFEVRGGPGYEDLTPGGFEALLTHLLPAAVEGVDHVKKHLVPRPR